MRWPTRQFESHFAGKFGSRWEALKRSLESSVNHIAWINSFADFSAIPAAFRTDWFATIEHSSGCTLAGRWHHEASDAKLPRPKAVPCSQSSSGDEQNLKSHYALDGASIFPVLALAPRRGQRVLDLCAAPGGKSLCLAGQLFNASSFSSDGGGADAAAAPSASSLLVANDCSAPRRARLRRVLAEFLPCQLLHEPHAAAVPIVGQTTGGADALAAAAVAAAGLGRDAVVVTGVDAARYSSSAPSWSAGEFDRILVDAPCSSERHFLRSLAAAAAAGPAKKQRVRGGGATWSVSLLERNAARQRSLLRNGARLLAVGGRLVYSTCSLADEENDGVVSALLGHERHGKGLVLVDALDGPLAEPSIAPLLAGVSRTECGALALPDESAFGPLYWAVIERRADSGRDGYGPLI